MGRKRKVANQNNNSARKIVRQEQEPEQVPEEHQNERLLNPLFMSEVLPKILNNLDVVSLKKSRLVCTLWRFEGGKILLNKTNIKLHQKSLQLEIVKSLENVPNELETFLNTANTFAPFNLSVKEMEYLSSLTNIPNLLLERTRVLSLSGRSSWSRNMFEDKKLLQFLESFSNLQVLNLSKNWNNMYHNFSVETQNRLLKKFETLKEIRLKRFASDFLILNDGTTGKLPVKEIQVGFERNANAQKRYLESVSRWPIDTLSLFFAASSFKLEHLPLLRVFLEKISSTLKHLELNCNYVPRSPLVEYLAPWSENTIIPPTLNGLESLKLNFENQFSNYPNDDFSWILLTCALQLPNLKKLWINRVPLNLEERISDWNNDPAALGRTLKSESLEELEIIQPKSEGGGMAAGSLLIFSCRLWPNLKSLLVQNPPIGLLSSFSLSEWICLERLDLKFHQRFTNSALWTKWLAGREPSIYPGIPDPSTFTIKNLKNLKHLGLYESRGAGSLCIATDFFVENSLKFMTQLQSLHLKNSWMSKKAKELLKDTLGPNANITFEY